MAMTAGSITVATDGTYSGTGFAKQVMDDLVTEYEDALSALSAPDPPIPARVEVLRGLARQATKFADLIEYIQANAETSVDAEGIL